MKKIAISLFVVIVLVIFLGNYYYKDKLMEKKERAIAAQEVMNERYVKIEAIEQEIYKDIPGLVVWGDSITAGAGGDGTTYPNVLKEIISREVYSIPVINMGVGGDNTKAIMGRAGSVPFVVNEFTIPKDNSKVEIKIQLSNGDFVAPMRQGNGGINPVTIAGVKGKISIEQESVVSDKYTYYFERALAGDIVEVRDNTVINIANDSAYNNYVPIIFMGQNGGYEDSEDLIKQIKSIISMDKSNDKYLVLGLTSGDEATREALEEDMEREFGNKYLNLREFISENGLEAAGIKATEKDKKAMKVGAVPPSLLYDTTHFNAEGYKVIAQVVYERLESLGYFDNVKNLLEEKKSL
ncbi:hypothetical protein M3612_17870 [Niallia taxi]|uniref:hypothetical protein n=1 Tax=Niallia taxi TaxID=2499688 RepID=UPI00203F2E50|nr:hypothetical protein [Niallia taxi]MCM3216355.1 hypothetical protein [Niallia taxi]